MAHPIARRSQASRSSNFSIRNEISSAPMPGIVGTISELGLKLESKKTDGERVYWITAGKGPACEPGNSAPAPALPCAGR